jgi:hypothetical protein
VRVSYLAGGPPSAPVIWQSDRQAGWQGSVLRRRKETLRRVDRWAGPDFHFDSQDSVASHARRPAVKWAGLLVAWVLVAGLLSLLHLGVLTWVIMAGLIAYVVYAVLRDTPRAARRRSRRATTTAAARAGAAATAAVDDGDLQFNAPPGWPDPPPGWTPPPGWKPDPAWPRAPAGWRFWLPSTRHRLGGHAPRTRSRHETDGYRSADRWL